MEHGPGEVLEGRYELQSVIARGPTTVTYAAIDQQSARRVGVRHWPAHAAQGLAAVELAGEAAVAGRVGHVHLARRLAQFTRQSPDGAEHYLVHDAGEGENLVLWGSRVPRKEAELRNVALGLLRALDALHRAGFVHGRLCADEVLVRADGRIYVMGAGGEQAPSGGPAGDLRAACATLCEARIGKAAGPSGGLAAALRGLSPAFRDWLERLHASGTPRGFTSAAAAMQALPNAPRPSGQRNVLALILVALALMGATGATGFYVMHQVRSFLSGRAATRRELGKPIGDTRFEAAGPAGPSLELTHLRSMAGHWSAIMDLAFDADGARIASASYDGSARLWSAEDGGALETFAHEGKVAAVAFMPPDRLVTGGGTVARVWDLAGGQMLRSLPADGQQVTSVVIAGGGKLMVTAGFGGELRVFDVEHAALVRTMKQPPKVFTVALDPEGTHLASGGSDGVVRIFRLDDGGLEHELRGHERAVNTLVFSGDGHTLASSSDDHTVRVWYLPGGKPMLTLEGHRDEVWALAIDPAGKQLASGSKDGELRIWDAYTGKLLLSQRADSRGVIALAFSPDGQRLAVGGGSQRIDLYSLRMQQPSWRPPAITAPVMPTPRPPPPKDASPELVLVYRARALIDDDEGHRNFPEAAGLLAQAIERNPKLAEAYVERARITYKTGHIVNDRYQPSALARAREELQRALEIDPDCYQAHLRMGSVNVFAKDYPAALQSAQKCEQLRPGDVETQVLFMQIAEAQEQDEQVLLHARAIIEGATDREKQAFAYASLIHVYWRRREYDAADEAYRSKINLEPESAWTKGNYASFLVRQERHDDAIRWARAAIAQMDYRAARMTLGEAYAGKARLALERGDEREYEDLLAQAFAADPDSAEGHYVKALALRRAHDEDGARRELQAALASDPEHARAKAALEK